MDLIGLIFSAERAEREKVAKEKAEKERLEKEKERQQMQDRQEQARILMESAQLAVDQHFSESLRRVSVLHLYVASLVLLSELRSYYF